MRALGLTSVFVATVSLACEPGTDVVAREIPIDAGTPIGKANDSSDSKKPDIVAQSSCSAPNAIAMTTKVGEIHWYDLASEVEIGSSPLECIGPGAGPVAIDRDGGVWIAQGGVVFAFDQKGLACKKSGLALTPTAMGFTSLPKQDRDVLYAVENGVLLAIDTSTFTRAPVGKLALDDVKALVGTTDGRLLAFAGDTPLVTVAEIALGDASIAAAWQVKTPPKEGGRFAGGVPTERGYDLVFGPNAYTFDPASGSVDFRVAMFAQDPGILSLSAAPCVSFAK